MSLMLGKLYTALKDAGASEQAAEAASAEVAGYETRLTNIEGELKLIRTELTIHRLMLGYIIAALTAVLFRVFT